MKYAFPITALIVLAIAGFFLMTRSKAPGQADHESPVPTATASAEGSPASPTGTAAAPGTYVTYTPDVIEKTPGTKVLFFHAPWCPQCRALEASIKAGTIPAGVTIIKVDYDSNQALRQKYGVTIQTSLVRVDDAGNLVKRYVAYEEPTLQSLKDNVL